MATSKKEELRMLTELFDLQDAVDGHAWAVSAKWIKYEELVEGIDHHWGRPHVPFISLKSFNHLKKFLQNGAVVLDPQVITFKEIENAFALAMYSECQMEFGEAEKLSQLLDRKKLGRINKKHSLFRPPSVAQNLEHKLSIADVSSNRKPSIISVGHDNAAYEEELDVCHIYAGEHKSITKNICVMLRLTYPMHIPELLDNFTKIRVIFLILGPPKPSFSYHELGRAVGILMSNQKFRETLLTADNKYVLVNELENFVNDSVLVPICDIDSNSLLNVDNIRKAFRGPRNHSFITSDNGLTMKEDLSARKSLPLTHVDEKAENGAPYVTQISVKHVQEPAPWFPDPFERTGRLFGGVVNDFKYRLPYYFDDFKCSLNFMCVTSIAFIFFANFANAVAIGGALSENTNKWFGVSEILVSHAVCGVIWGFFAGQPLCIMAAVGPFLVFESSMYEFCEQMGVDFLATRWWTGLWTFIMMTLLAMVEAPFLMRYLTRFTEDIFTGLIALIFIYAGLRFVYFEFEAHPLQHISSYCTIFDESQKQLNFTFNDTNLINSSITSLLYNETLEIVEAEQEIIKIENQPDTALLSCILFLLTFLLAYFLKKLRMSIYCGRTIRRAVGDFGVPIAILIVTFLDEVVFDDVYTSHLEMKNTFSLTDPTLREWLVPPFGPSNNQLPLWVIGASIIPAVLNTILLYAEVEIVEALLAKKERGLTKPSGFHWDLILCGLLAFVCSIFGLQWMCPAAVQTLSHGSSLTIMKKAAPGEAPRIERVIENRVTCIIIGLLHGVAACLGIVLTLIPKSALFGIFFYLGVIGLLSLQFWQRVVLFFVPEKYFPDEPYCQNVLMRRMHLFTFIQLICFACLWAVNMFGMSALAFPFVLMLIAVFRLTVFPKIYSPADLQALDGKPENNKPTSDGKVDTKENEDEDFYDQISQRG